MLTAAGFTYKGSQLIDPKGNPVRLDIHVISGWSDWVASDQIIAKNLQAIGINSTEVLEPDWNSWYPNASTTKFPTLLWQNDRALRRTATSTRTCRSRSTRPRGGRHDNEQLGALLRRFLAVDAEQLALDAQREAQNADFVKLATLFLKDQPIIPVFIGPRWSTYSTKYFHGFTSPKNFYGTRSSPPTPTTSSPSPGLPLGARPAPNSVLTLRRAEPHTPPAT